MVEFNSRLYSPSLGWSNIPFCCLSLTVWGEGGELSSALASRSADG